MPESIERAVSEAINLTRQGLEQTKWKASPSAVICNVHHGDCVGPRYKQHQPIFFTSSALFPARVIHLSLQKATAGPQSTIDTIVQLPPFSLV